MPVRAPVAMAGIDRGVRLSTVSSRSVLRLVFPGDASSVRHALQSAMEVFRELPLDDARLGVTEIVLAEVLNNVAEHAYAGRARGLVEVEAEQLGAALRFRIVDDGGPMPGLKLPPGHAPHLDVATDDLPEGGFGWLLIREVTEGLTYRRIDDRNELVYQIPLDAPGPNA